MKALLICPRYAEALWTHKYARKFMGKKGSSPPLGLLTVAALLPQNWEKRFIDLNVVELTGSDFEWADIVLVGAMLAQYSSAMQVIDQAHRLHKRILAGGPLFCPELIEQGRFADVDHIIVGEAEALVPRFLEELSTGQARKIYQQDGYPDIHTSPVPMWSLVNLHDYGMVNLQFVRGCPFDCEFCYGHVLNGHHLRAKSRSQIIAELDALYASGWRSSIFVCDDNLVGNRQLARDHVLPALSEWMREKDYPFTFTGAASVNLAREPEIMDMLVSAGFDSVTLGIESPHAESLAEVHKQQNLNLDFLEIVHTIQNHGLVVHAGMILGFDNDPPDIFDKQVEFIQESGIPNALVSLLFAFPNTPLYDRLMREKRLIPYTIGDAVYGAINFAPAMPLEVLKSGHKRVLRELYCPEGFYRRVENFLQYYRPVPRRLHLQPEQVLFVARALYLMGIKDRWRIRFWLMLIEAIRKGAAATYLRIVITGYFERLDIAQYAPEPAVGLFAVPENLGR